MPESVAVGQLLRALRLLGVDRLHALALLEVIAFNDLWMAGLGLFGLHLLLAGCTRPSGGISRASAGAPEGTRAALDNLHIPRFLRRFAPVTGP